MTGDSTFFGSDDPWRIPRFVILVATLSEAHPRPPEPIALGETAGAFPRAAPQQKIACEVTRLLLPAQDPAREPAFNDLLRHVPAMLSLQDLESSDRFDTDLKGHQAIWVDRYAALLKCRRQR